MLYRRFFVNNVDSLILSGPKLLLPIIRIKTKKINEFHGDEPNEPPRYWKSKHPAFHLKYRTSPPKTIPKVLDIMGRLDNHAVDNSDVEVYNSYYPSEFTYNYDINPYNTPIK